jgi:O-antigen/teichoic acid export membrane protein
VTVARTVARNSLVQLAGRGITMAVSLGTLSLLSRYLGPEDFGKYQFVIAFLLLVNVSDFGVATLAVRHLSTEEREADDLMGNVVVVRSVLAGFSTVIAIAIAFIVGYPAEIKAAIAVAALSFPLMIASGAYNATFAANLRMEYATIGNIAQAGVTLAGMGLVAANGGGLIALLFAFNFGVLVNSLICLHFARRFVRTTLSFDSRYSLQLLREAAPLGLAVLIITAYGRLDILLLRAFTDDESVGYYGFAYRIVDLAFPLSFFFVGSVFPLLSTYHDRHQLAEFRSMYARAWDVLSIAAVGIVTAVVLFASPIVHVIGGSEYAPAVISMQVLVGAVALIWLSNLADHGMIAIGRQGVLLWIALGGLCVNVASNLVLIPLYREEGAAVATVLTEITVLVPAVWVVSQYTRDAPSFALAARLVPVALVSAVAVYALPLHWSAEAAVVSLIFATGVLALRVVSLSEIRSLLTRHSAAETMNVRGRVEVGAGN